MDLRINQNQQKEWIQYHKKTLHSNTMNHEREKKTAKLGGLFFE
jgi:hypothetical protein